MLRLIPDVNDGDKLKAWTLLTALDEIRVSRNRSVEHGRRVNLIRAIFAVPTGST